MKKYVLSSVLLLLASSQFMALSQDAAKPAPVAKVAEKAVEKPADAKSDPKAVVDDKKPEKKADEKKAETEKSGEKKPSNRLPSNYGKLGLTDAQKARVYAVQDKHEAEIDTLNEKLKATKAARDAEIETVLTPEQKKTLKEITTGKDSKDDSKESAKSGKGDSKEKK